MHARSRSALRVARFVGVAAITVAAANHGRLAAESVGDVARHELVVGLDLALAVLLAVKPRWALAPTAVMSAQQMWSHGSDLVDSMQGPGPIDVVSALVVVFFPALLALLAIERRAFRERGLPICSGTSCALYDEHASSPAGRVQCHHSAREGRKGAE